MKERLTDKAFQVKMNYEKNLILSLRFSLDLVLIKDILICYLKIIVEIIKGEKLWIGYRTIHFYP